MHFYFFATEIEFCIFCFFLLVKEYKWWKHGTNMANIVLLSANQIADIFLC